MEPGHKSGENDIPETGLSIYVYVDYSFHDELSDIEIMSEK